MASVPKPDPKVAINYFRQKLDCTCGAVELKHWVEEKAPVNIIDVRQAEDYAKGHIPGAVNITRDKWSDPTGLSKNKTNVVYCYTQTCHLAAAAALEFAQKGYSVVELEGGFDNWKTACFTVESAPVTVRS